MKAVVFTLGCKVNDVESGSMIRGLEMLGYAVSRELAPADLYIINTCAVTGEAERKSRQAIARALKFNPDARIIVCGCASEKSPASFLEKGVTAVVGAQKKNRVLEIVRADFADGFCGLQTQNAGGMYEEMLLPDCLKTRRFVKIQDGCNRFCSYCVIPYLRGRSRSRYLESAAAEILLGGAYETVITGIDISSYRDEKGRDLADLLWTVRGADTRLRLGSMEVSLITERFLEVLKEVKNFAPHFHLSLQSGSNRVLKSMNRHYTREEYLEKCAMIRRAFPKAAITTDIIAGFPTETEEDFEQSLSIIKEVGFAQIHAFPYSPREGTNAFKKYKELPAALKKERVEKLLAAGEEARKKYLESFIGEVLTVIPERVDGEMLEGYSENYIRVYVPFENTKKPIQVCVFALHEDGVMGMAE